MKKTGIVREQQEIELSIVMPCLNEAETLACCIQKAHSFLTTHHVRGEVVVADNGSTDQSRAIAQENAARVIEVPNQGYGNALMAGMNAARGEYIIMGDADDSYDFLKLKPFLEKLRNGYDVVVGNRFEGGIDDGAMPFLHKYIGNPMLSLIGRLFYNIPVGDFHCGLRGISKTAVERLPLRAPGMEFASEMIVKARLQKLRITEVPTTLKPDGRSTQPHLNTWRDGWRHLRFLLLYAPKWLFWYPGVTIAGIGTALSLALIAGPVSLGEVVLDIHTLLYAMAMVLVGYQWAAFYRMATITARQKGLQPKEKSKTSKKKYSLEKGLATGIIFIVIGFGCSLWAVWQWKETGFGNLQPMEVMRLVIPGVMSGALGLQVIVNRFYEELLSIAAQKDTP